jgi:hypothetical protein
MSMVERGEVPRSKFIGSWTHKKAFNASVLYPFLVDEVLPGDHLKYNVAVMVRMATLLFPQFDQQKLETFFFFVPNRLVWQHWVNLMGEQANPTDSITYTVPTVQSPTGGFALNSIFDHMGLPVVGQTDASSAIVVNCLPMRAYELIYNQWFRDENLINSVPVSTGDGPDLYTAFPLQNRAKSHDYFTSALPWPQKFTAPSVPLVGLAPVVGLGFTGTPTAGPVSVWETAATGTTSYPDYISGGANMYAKFLNGAAVGNTNLPQIFANLAGASGVTINALRQSWLIQQMLEKQARGGTRYTERVFWSFGVRSPDMRLQRPEYIGGGSSPMNVTPIAQTAPPSGSFYPGSLSAAGTAVGQHVASYAATEHGYIIGLLNVRSDLSYSQGIHKMWTRSTQYDFYEPSLSGLGEQAILLQEIFSKGYSTDSTTVFGYQERWMEYRTRYSEVTTIFRPYVSGTLDAWHLSEAFGSSPTLGQTFVEDQGQTILNRVLAASSLAQNQQYLADILIQREAVRPVPMYGTPIKLGRF